MAISTTPKNRFGLHYFADTLHYRENDLRAWLPELRDLGISWLVLQAEATRAIPESFLKGIISAGIEPILQFNLNLEHEPNIEELSPLLAAYQDWGVKYVSFYDRPNRRSAWKAADWMQSNLVQRFVERFVPLAEAAIEHGMKPIFSPLEPGGDYWDTAFLRVALQALLKQNKNALLEKLIIGAYAGAGEKQLTWGIGGPERWVRARPYFTPEDEQDERGFYIFDWYRAICEAILGVELPLMLFGAGSPGAVALTEVEGSKFGELKEDEHLQRTISIVKLVHDDVEPPFFEKLPASILACNFWVLGSAGKPNNSMSSQEVNEKLHTPLHLWYRTDGTTSPLVGFLRQWQEDHAREVVSTAPEAKVQLQAAAVEQFSTKAVDQQQVKPKREQQSIQAEKEGGAKTHPIAAYLLIPLNAQGSMEFELAPIYPFIKKQNLTVGFSLDEAALAARVIILDHQQNFPLEEVERLRTFGCKVVRISGLGMEIAQFLSSL